MIVDTDILLVQTELFSDIKNQYLNVGLLYIAAQLKKENFSVELIRSTVTKIDRYRPKVIGFALNSDNITLVKYHIEELKKSSPFIVIGGPLISALGEEALEKTGADFAISGEGEYSFTALCNYLIRGHGSLNEIRGLSYRENGKLYSTLPPEPIADLDLLPSPDYTPIEPHGSISYSSGRGCPYSCTFCFKGAHGNRYRYFSAKRVVRELIDYVERYSLKAVAIIDDTFTANIKRAREVCRELTRLKKERGLDFALYCESRIDSLYRNRELIDDLKEAGFKKLQSGIENGNQKILDAYNKRITLDQIRDVVSLIGEKDGLTIVSNFIFGGAFEDEYTAEQTTNFAIELLHSAAGRFEAEPCFLAPYPQTAVKQNPEKFQLKIIDPEWLTAASSTLPSCETTQLDQYRIIELRNQFVSKVRDEMKKIIMQNPKLLDHSFELRRYGFNTNYNSLFQNNYAISQFYALKESGFARMEDLRTKHLIPKLTTLPIRDERGRYRLKGGLKKIKLRSKLENYILSKLPMPIDSMARAMHELGFPESESEIITNRILPFMKLLEDNFYIIFDTMDKNR